MTAFESMLDLPFPTKPRAEAGLRADAQAQEQAAERPPRGLAPEAGFLVNGDRYFAKLAAMLPQARQSIWIIGWDFNPDIQLEPTRSAERLGERLHALVEDNPLLEVNILVWALGPVYSGKSLRLLRRQGFPRHPRIRLRFHMHPDIRGSHHQKIVVIDDRIAFTGGIDLTAKRWDTWEHRPDEPLRCDPKGSCYDPLHDVQAMVTGDAARLLGDVARHRWQAATGELVRPAPPMMPAPEAPALACGLATRSLSAVPVTVAMTDLAAGRRDGAGVTRDLIRRAQRHLYIETQYLASFSIADVLAERLREPDGPEIVVICTRSSHGILEKILMANNRDRIIRRLKRVDHQDRLRVYYPVVPASSGEREVLVHSKLLIADDRLLRIGSSNINNRSEGLDTECDILFAAEAEDHGLAISGLRDALVGEHLGLDGGSITRAVAETGSLISAIETLNVAPRGLRAFDIPPEGRTDPMPGTSLLDPKGV